MNHEYPIGIALDIGTTNIVMQWADLRHQTILDCLACPNQQIRFGRDVIQRIDAASRGKTHDMHLLLIHQIREMMSMREEWISSVDSMYICGNTTMLHLLCDVSPASMGTYPFTPLFLQSRQIDGHIWGWPISSVATLPGISSFVGSDANVGLYDCSCRHPSNAPFILADVGTNAEMLLYLPGEPKHTFATAVAAGPAFEGVGISCGASMTKPNVITCVSHGAFRGDLQYQIANTNNYEMISGFSGTGLLELCACLMDLGVLHIDGSMDTPSYAIPHTHLSLTIKDAEQLLLAKAAIQSGFDLLLQKAGMTPASFIRQNGTVFLSGAFGKAISPKALAQIGIMPRELLPTIVFADNTALDGTTRLLLNPDSLADLEHMAENTTSFSPNEVSSFESTYMSHLHFG